MMMKRAVSFVLFGLGSAVLFGCPIYPAERDHRVCIGSDCYACPDPHYSGSCSAWMCTHDLDCPSGYACNHHRRCSPVSDTPPSPPACAQPSDCPGGNCGADNQCHPGDCSTSGCPLGFVCKLEAGAGAAPHCAPIGAGGGVGQPSSCQNDDDCPTPAGSKCLSGTCVAPQDQCADATQCPGEAACVDGACTPTCSGTKPCPTGYACDDKGVCTENPSPCTSSSQCTDGKVCVQEHCVDPCGANGACAPGLVCIDGGCTPDEKPVFTCNTEGTQDACQPGSICLRHSCYIACDPADGPEACKSADTFNECKSVTTSSGTYNVCGSTSNLGTECDPTQNKHCTMPAVCIDGYCR